MRPVQGIHFIKLPALLKPLTTTICLFTLALATPSRADDDADFQAAREAYGKGQMVRFGQAAAKIDSDYPLRAYIQYWRLKSNSPEPADMEAYIGRFPDSPLAERLRFDLARNHAQNGDWAAFRRWSAQLSKPDTEIRCYGLSSRLAIGDVEAAREGVQLYLTGKDLPSGCAAVFATLFERGELRPEDRVARLRLALEAGNLRLARELIDAMPEASGSLSGMLARAEREPSALAQEAPTGAAREIALYALTLVAKSDPAEAARLWERAQAKYEESERQYGWGQIAAQAARQLHPEAADWFLRNGEHPSETQAVWRARAMLRAGRWPEVHRAILAMPEALQEEAVWRYWKARALKAQGLTVAANASFARLSREIHYYGVLASEELPVRLETPPQDYRPSQDELRAIRALPGIERALRLRRLGMLAEATSEWLWAMRAMNDPQLLAAAEVARQESWYDRAIHTADATRDSHNFDLRYMTPYRDLAEAYAREQDIDPAWVFGLMRQESRFVDYARSSAGAVGLMQIMPATARWIANQLGDRHAHAGVREPATNIRFGTYYLKNIHERLGGSPVLATAGYNAGPGRARKWQAAVPLEGAVYVESIPFAETREYVKKVLTNAIFYSQRLGTPSTKLKDRLGTIPPRSDSASGNGGKPDI